MADIKWIKLTTNMHEDEKMRLIDAMPERDTIHYLWIRLLVQAGKTNADGDIFLSEDMPYTDKMLAIIFSRPLASIKLALKTLSRLGMIEIAPDKVIRIVNWDKHQNIEGMERVRAQNRKRVEVHREKKKQIEKTTKENHEEEKQNNDDVKVQEDQGENLKVSVEDNEKIIPLDSSILNSNINTGEMEQSLDTDKCAAISEQNLDNSESVIKSTSENYCNTTNNDCNVTHNESNVTVTKQNKKEIENKNKKKNKREIESENNKITDDINNKDSTHDEAKGPSLSQGENHKENPIAIAENDINSKAIELMTYHEKITGIIGGINYVALRLAIDMHGVKPVKMAIDRALEASHTEMGYINGILKNWRKEGYPKDDMEVKKNGVRSNGKSNSADKNEFTGFKPKKPRNLTEDERKGAEKNLI